MVIVVDFFAALVVCAALVAFIGEHALEIVLLLLFIGAGMGVIHLLAKLIVWLTL